MEGSEVEDISPALEATEDYLHCLNSAQETGQVYPPKLKEVLTLDKLNSSGVWGLLTGEQPEISSHNLAWAEQTSFSVLGLKNGKRNRARSTNDLAAHAKETNSTSSSSGGFKRGHNRSRSDVNYRSYTDSGVPAIDKNTLKNMALNNQMEGKNCYIIHIIVSWPITVMVCTCSGNTQWPFMRFSGSHSFIYLYYPLLSSSHIFIVSHYTPAFGHVYSSVYSLSPVAWTIIQLRLLFIKGKEIRSSRR